MILYVLCYQLAPSMDATDTNKEESRIGITANDDAMRTGQITPPLFPSVPALNGAASYFAETTSYLTSCFPVNSDIAPTSYDGTEVVGIKELKEPLLSSNAPPSHDVITRNSDRPQNNIAIVPSDQTSQSGFPCFKVHGSSDDIGWLQRAPGMPPIEDGTERFNNILDNIMHGIHVLPNSMVYLLVPGLFSNHGPLYFTSTKATFSKMGLTCHIAKIHSEASVEKNAREIKEYIEEVYWGSKKRVLLLGHSKGGVDAAAALSMYWPDLRDKVAGLALAQSPYGGSPIASDIMREGQIGDYFNVRKLMEILICKVIKGDLQALEDLTYEKRKEFLRKHQLPKELPVVSFHTEANISPAVLATLSRVAHAELPAFTNSAATVLPVVVPLGATLAACAQLLQTRYGEKSDGLVTCRDAEVPGSVVVHPKRKLDHAWMVYSSTNDDPLEPDASQVCEALLTLVVEVGLRNKHYLSVKQE
ncbi:putative alpha/Beta hydrolase [Helianthus annuus]|nr:putative alpha/Beta hydrolase [Helianthus annuus]